MTKQNHLGTGLRRIAIGAVFLGVIMLLFAAEPATAQRSPAMSQLPWWGLTPQRIDNDFTTIIGESGTELIENSKGRYWYTYTNDLRLKLPFDFTFLGTEYAEGYDLIVAHQGWLSFSGYTGDNTVYGSFPTTAYSSDGAVNYRGRNQCIAPYWSNFSTEGVSSPDGGVYYRVEGTSPNRILIVEWRVKVGLYGSDEGNFQAKLFENGSAIEFHYGPEDIERRKPATGYTIGYGAIVGVRNYGQAQTATEPDAASFKHDSTNFLLFVHPDETFDDGDRQPGADTTAITRVNTIKFGYSNYYPVEYAYSPSYDAGSVHYYRPSPWWHYRFPTEEGEQIGYRLSQQSSSVTLTSPNGGETWCLGKTKSIEWSASDVSNVKLELSTDGGSTWSTVVSSTSASTGLYSWTVSGVSSTDTDCMIRVSDADDASTSDASDATFTINTVEITDQPDDAAVVAGTNASFTVAASGSPTVQWQVSTDEGTTWSDISGETGTSYSLTTAITDDGNQYRAVLNNGTCSRTSSVATLTVKVRATDLGPAVVFFGPSTAQDNGRKIDVKVALYKNGTLIANGENSEEILSGPNQNSSRKVTVSLTMEDSQYEFTSTDELQMKVFARINSSGEGNNGATSSIDAELFYNDSPSPEINAGNKGWARLGQANVGGQTSDYFYLRTGSNLSGTAGESGTSIEKTVGSDWVLFDTWSIAGANMKAVYEPIIGKTGESNHVLVLPNPVVDGMMTVYAPGIADPGIRLELMDLTGRSIQSWNAVTTGSTNGYRELDVSRQAEGTYILRITGADLKIAVPVVIR